MLLFLGRRSHGHVNGIFYDWVYIFCSVKILQLSFVLNMLLFMLRFFR